MRMTTNEAEERLYAAFGRQWTIETGRAVNPDGTVTTENVTVEATVEAIKAATRRATVERIQEQLGTAPVQSDQYTANDEYRRFCAILEEVAR